MAERGRAAIRESEDDEGLQALMDLVAVLDDEEFAAMAEGVIAVDDPSQAAVDTFFAEGETRALALMDQSKHLAAVVLASRCCSPSMFAKTCLKSLKAHPDGADAIRAKILHITEKNPLLLARVGGKPPIDED